MLRSAVGEIIAIDRRDDDVLETETRHGIADTRGLVRIELTGPSRGDIAERASTRADVAHDHHRGVTLLPAFADVGAGRFLTDRSEAVIAHNSMRVRETL
jgi:hypothetical protein